MTTPTRLDLDSDGVAHCAKFDVYFNGKKQSQCLIADVTKGYVMRYKSLFGVIVFRNKTPQIEERYGTVAIVPKGETP